MGGSTKNITETGLGDAQFDTLAQNQSNISTQIGDTSTQLDTRAQELSGQVGQGFTDVGQNLQQIGQQQQDGFAQVGEDLSGLSGQVGDVGQAVQQTGADLSGQLSGVGEQVTQGFNMAQEGFGMTQDQLDRLSGQFAGFDETMTNQVNELGADVGSRLNDLSGTVQNQGQQASQERQEVYQGLSDQLGSGFGEAATQLADAQSSIMGGQQQLNTLLEDTGNRLDTYYGGLTEGQQGLAQQVGGVQTGLNDFAQQYDQDTTLANDARADIQQGLVNATDRIREDVGRMSDAASANQQRLVAAVGGNAEAIQEGTQNLASTVEGGFADQSAQEQRQNAEFSQSINRVRTLLQATGDNLDQQTRQQYSELVNSFDQNGQLIQRSIDDQGLTVARQLDDQNNLIVGKFNQAGEQVGALDLNVNRMLQQAELFEQGVIDRAAGANARMSQLTRPTQQAGFMSPYTQTR